MKKTIGRTGFSLVELMLALAIAMAVGVLGVMAARGMEKEGEAERMAKEMEMIGRSLEVSYGAAASYSGLTTASALSSGAVRDWMRCQGGSVCVNGSKTAVDFAEETVAVQGGTAPAFAMFARDVSGDVCSKAAGKLSVFFDKVLVNSIVVKESDGAGFLPGKAAEACHAGGGNQIKVVKARMSPWVGCRSLGRQFREESCPAGQTGRVVMAADYSCAASGGVEPGAFGAWSETERSCCNATPPQTEARADCAAPKTGSRVWERRWTCPNNGGNEPGEWTAWSVKTDSCACPAGYAEDPVTKRCFKTGPGKCGSAAISWMQPDGPDLDPNDPNLCSAGLARGFVAYPRDSRAGTDSWFKDQNGFVANYTFPRWNGGQLIQWHYPDGYGKFTWTCYQADGAGGSDASCEARKTPGKFYWLWGIWCGACDGAYHANPVTGSISCPAGYVPKTHFGSSSGLHHSCFGVCAPKASPGDTGDGWPTNCAGYPSMPD